MTIYWKLLAIAVLAGLMTQMLEQKAMAWLLLLGAAVGAAALTSEILRPLTDFFTNLQAAAILPGNYLVLLLKVLAVGLSSELSAQFCKEAGAEGLGKIVHFAGSALIVNVTLPVYTELLELLQKLMGGL